MVPPNAYPKEKGNTMTETPGLLEKLNAGDNPADVEPAEVITYE